MYNILSAFSLSIISFSFFFYSTTINYFSFSTCILFFLFSFSFLATWLYYVLSFILYIRAGTEKLDFSSFFYLFSNKILLLLYLYYHASVILPIFSNLVWNPQFLTKNHFIRIIFYFLCSILFDWSWIVKTIHPSRPFCSLSLNISRH